MPKTTNHGHAVYFEFHDKEGKGNVAQVLVIGHTFINETDVPYRMLSRTITPEHPQKPWRADPTKPADGLIYQTNGMPLRNATDDVALELALQDWSEVVGTVDAIAAFAWEPYGEPFIIQVSPLDIQDLANRTSPKKLIDRLNRVRIAQGYSDLPKKVTV